MPSWLRKLTVPLFVSRKRLWGYKTLPRAAGPWALDSGAFSELKDHGRFTFTARQYAADARRFRDEIGNMRWAAVMDWMCEKEMLANTGLGVREHQRRTIDSFLELSDLAPEMPWVPVLQGWSYGDYLRHADDYAAAGIDLEALPLVGLGSVCRRQHTGTAERLAFEFHCRGLRLHGFGFKIEGLARAADLFASADSMAWSYAGRKRGIPNGANSMPWALAWRERVLEAVAEGQARTEGVLF